MLFHFSFLMLLRLFQTKGKADKWQTLKTRPNGSSESRHYHLYFAPTFRWNSLKEEIVQWIPKL